MAHQRRWGQHAAQAKGRSRAAAKCVRKLAAVETLALVRGVRCGVCKTVPNARCGIGWLVVGCAPHSGAVCSVLGGARSEMMISRAGPSKVFISYRRTDAGWPTRWLADRLAGQFGAGVVFQDVDSIRPGDDFAAEIEAAVGACSVLLVVIGPQWLAAAGDAGRRLDDPQDWVRLEIETAIRRGIRIIPVLVDGARMPSADELARPDPQAGRGVQPSQRRYPKARSGPGNRPRR